MSEETKPRKTGPRIQLDVDVYEAALERIRWIFKEFDGKVVCTSSGGKDSTVVMELAAKVAREEGYPPLKVFFLDQEAEFGATVEYLRHLNTERDDIDFTWYQVPYRMENSLDQKDPWFIVWDPDKENEWIREKEEKSVKELSYPVKGKKNFYDHLEAIRRNDYEGYVTLDGMRMEESPTRRMMMIANPAYKWATWSTGSPGNYRFQPVYDWSYRDIWTAIYRNNWRYNTHYDTMYQYGVAAKHMRVSSFTHAQAQNSLLSLQEIEPETWERALVRWPGMSTFGHLKKDQKVFKLPYMFGSWIEYALYLLENLIEEGDRHYYEKQYKVLEELAKDDGNMRDWNIGHVLANAIIMGDYHGTRIRQIKVMKRMEK